MIKHYRLRLGGYYLALIFVLISVLSIGEISRAALCSKWSEGKKSGTLNHNLINEASGIEASNKFPGRLYHINDSGGGHYFYITDSKGDKTQKIRIEGATHKRSDFEDLSLGECFSNKSCVFIADIGDNKRRRESVEIIVIEELEHYGHSVYPLKRLNLVYPDQSHNAEGMAVHPNGDIYILTKEEDLDESEAYPAKLYRLSSEKWQNSGEKMQLLEYIADIDFRHLNPSGTAYGQVVSAFDIALDGKSFLVLTYENAFEFNTDLAKNGIKETQQLKNAQDYNMIELKSLPQQESISYLPSGKGFLYNTEFHWFEVPMIRVDCLD
ncbi:MAG: hypothetical protein V3U19_05350 [Thermodesulfobacteriota bacterium]|nr:hypothetical protein [Candidatus Dadabacteria bacterium]MCZ6638497.1 hypothetical protein [Candidatus Dadabacteria bacterium]MCZ6790937.1 hypothetical protein [Candidatus Dadabacteria bacterium]